MPNLPDFTKSGTILLKVTIDTGTVLVTVQEPDPDTARNETVGYLVQRTPGNLALLAEHLFALALQQDYPYPLKSRESDPTGTNAWQWTTEQNLIGCAPQEADMIRSVTPSIVRTLYRAANAVDQAVTHDTLT